MNALNLVFRPSELIIFLAKMLTAKLPVLVVGRVGIGKSDIFSQAAADANFDLIISHPVISDPTDFKGLPSLTTGGDCATFLPFGDLHALMTATRPTLFFLDDLGQAPSAVQAAVMQLILAREINGKKISDQVVFMAATNRPKDGAGVSAMLTPLLDRFTIAHLEPTLEDWIQWALSKSWMPLELISAVRRHPKWITEWNRPKRGSIENCPTPRSIAEVAKIMALGLPNAIQTKAIAGRIGEGNAIALQALLNCIHDLPSINEVASDPMGARLPSSTDATYMMVGALIGNATTANADAFIQYARRLGGEMSVAFMRDLTVRKPECCNVSAYTEWAVANAHLLI